MFCLETYLKESDDYLIHMSRSGFKDCAEFIEKNSKEVIHVKAGTKIVGARIIGIPPIPIGIDIEKSQIMIPYTKPCYGTAVVEVPVDLVEIKKIKDAAIP
ncbi:MAG: DUF1894 domain-containing protein [Methanobacteriaceae archaeon]|nr:DUF1894 domain-containing protein [Methanobacteriaceae archaeon]